MPEDNPEIYNKSAFLPDPKPVKPPESRSPFVEAAKRRLENGFS